MSDKKRGVLMNKWDIRKVIRGVEIPNKKAYFRANYNAVHIRNGLFSIGSSPYIVMSEDWYESHWLQKANMKQGARK